MQKLRDCKTELQKVKYDNQFAISKLKRDNAQKSDLSLREVSEKVIEKEKEKLDAIKVQKEL